MKTKISISLANSENSEVIDHIRHTVYASELGQFTPTLDESIHDRPEVQSTYIAAFENETLVGFVAITPSTSPKYSFDKYLNRTETGLNFDEGLFEIRALTVVDQSRGTMVAPALMYAAFRWAQSNQGKNIVAIGHQKVRAMYMRLGMRASGKRFQCGNLEYELLAAPLDEISKELTRFDGRLKRLEGQIDWKLNIPFHPLTECYHGGAFFNAIGDTFENLTRRNQIINADVLDAWFPPCPKALQALHENLGWIMRTSPPNHAEGLVKTIAKVRNVSPEHILAGGGSSPLIFLAFRHWLTPSSKVLILNPMYGEYAHVLKSVIGCQVEQFKLRREDEYQVNLSKLAGKVKENFDLIVFVNPNSPTGRHVKRCEMITLLRECPGSTKIWIDETYVEYAGKNQSLEQYAANSRNTVIVKSMSKVYALSGLRVGYLCGTPNLIKPLRGLTPPWSVSLPAQIAAINALHSPAYYQKQYRATAELRSRLISDLRSIGISEIIPGIANFILFHLPPHSVDGGTLIKRCQKKGLFVRDASEMGHGMGDRAIRIAVKDAETNKRMIGILSQTLKLTEQKEVCHD